MNEFNPTWRPVGCLAAAAAVVFLTACSDAGIKAAKHEPYPKHSGTTFEKVLDNYQWCNKKNWERKELKTGEKYVEFTCMATEPDVKATITAHLAELDQEKADEMAKIRARSEETFKQLRDNAYGLQRAAATSVETYESNLREWDARAQAGKEPYVPRSQIVTQLQEAQAILTTYQTPEYTAEAERKFLKDKQEVEHEVAAHFKELDAQSARRQEALTDGKIKILLQWQLTQSGSIGHYGMGVTFDFGDRQFEVDGQDGVADDILATLYQDKPILNGLRKMLYRDAVPSAPDGLILYSASRKSLSAKSRS